MSRKNRYKEQPDNSSKAQPDKNSSDVMRHADEFFELSAKQTRNPLEETKLSFAIRYLTWAVEELKEGRLKLSADAVAELAKYTDYLAQQERAQKQFEKMAGRLEKTETEARRQFLASASELFSKIRDSAPGDREAALLKQEVRIAKAQIATQQARLVAQDMQAQRAAVEARADKLRGVEENEQTARSAFFTSEQIARQSIFDFFRANRNDAVLASQRDAEARGVAAQLAQTEELLQQTKARAAKAEQGLAESQQSISNAQKHINALESSQERERKVIVETIRQLTEAKAKVVETSATIDELTEAAKRGHLTAEDLAAQLKNARDEGAKAVAQIERLTAAQTEQQLAANKTAEALLAAQNAQKEAAAEAERVRVIAEDRAAALEEAKLALDGFDSMKTVVRFPAGKGITDDHDDCAWDEDEDEEGNEKEAAAAPRSPGM